ncbi:MAG TPA: hypothetical protein VGJ74_00980 [Burkholderiales bacterium]
MRIQIPQSLRLEHDELHHFLAAARAAQRIDYVEFAEKLINHARMEEEVLYPAAIVVGEYLRLRLALHERIVAL